MSGPQCKQCDKDDLPVLQLHGAGQPGVGLRVLAGRHDGLPPPHHHRQGAAVRLGPAVW